MLLTLLRRPIPTISTIIRPITILQTPITLRHSRTMKIQSIPMWPGKSDNYAYLLTDPSSSQSAIIDPAEPDAVLAVLNPLKTAGTLHLKAIINTHHHRDHAGGNRALLAAFPGLPIIGGADCDGVTETPGHGKEVELGSLRLRALHTPCHTKDSICWFVDDKATNERAVFTGDTLFHGGCGRFFEGDATQMHAALNKELASLPGDTKVFPGHEYTKANVAFGISVLKSEAMERLQKFAEENPRTEGRFTIENEKGHNVFMRVGDPEVQAKTGCKDPVEVMAKLREMKNNF